MHFDGCHRNNHLERRGGVNQNKIPHLKHEGLKNSLMVEKITPQ